MRTRARTDGNHTAIVHALRATGCRVLSLASVGKGCPDLLVLDPQGVLHLVEVKSPRGKLEDDQVVFHERWPVHVARTAQQAVNQVLSRHER